MSRAFELKSSVSDVTLPTLLQAAMGSELADTAEFYFSLPQIPLENDMQHSLEKVRGKVAKIVHNENTFRIVAEYCK